MCDRGASTEHPEVKTQAQTAHPPKRSEPAASRSSRLTQRLTESGLVPIGGGGPAEQEGHQPAPRQRSSPMHGVAFCARFLQRPVGSYHPFSRTAVIAGGGGRTRSCVQRARDTLSAVLCFEALSKLSDRAGGMLVSHFVTKSPSISNRPDGERGKGHKTSKFEMIRLCPPRQHRAGSIDSSLTFPLYRSRSPRPLPRSGLAWVAVAGVQ